MKKKIGIRMYRNRHKVWTLDLRPWGGKRVSLGTTDRNLAEEIRIQKEAEIIQDKFNINLTTAPDITLTQAFDYFFTNKSLFLRPRTIARYKNSAEHFIEGNL